MIENSASEDSDEPDDDRNNVNGEDDELVLEGSELHKYLTSCLNYEIGVYNVDKSPKKLIYPEQQINCKKAPKEILELIRIILNSNLLMEEDASFLFRFSSDFLPEEDSFMYSKKFAFGLFFLGIFFAVTHLIFDSLDVYFLTLISGIVVALFPYGKRFYYASKCNKRLIQLTKVLQDTFFFIRKIIRNVYDDDSLLTSKEMMYNLKRGNEELFKAHLCKKKLLEVVFLSSNTMSSLKQLIITSRKATFSLMELKKRDCAHDNYIALCSDEQLGLDIFNCAEDYNHITELNRLKNIYLLMQSECLRILGLCLLEHHGSLSLIFEVMNAYKRETLSVLNILQNQYKTYYQPDLPSIENNCLNHKKSESYLLFHDLSRSLKSLLVDVRHLEDYTETNDHQSLEIDPNIVSSSLINIEKELFLLITMVRNLKERLLHSASINQSELENNCLKEIETVDAEVKKINVGFSDFSLSGIDEVFLGSTDNVCADCPEKEDLPDIDNFKPPAAFMYELKSALINKRNEFEEREIKALKTTEDIEAYKSCLNGGLLPMGNINCQSSNNNEKCAKSDLYATQNPYKNTDLKCELDASSSVDHNPSAEPVSSVSLSSKNIALSAVNISSEWKSMKTVDYFVDDSEDSTSELSSSN